MAELEENSEGFWVKESRECFESGVTVTEGSMGGNNNGWFGWLGLKGGSIK